MATRKTAEERLQELKEREEQLKKQKQKLQAQISQEKRKRETRLKIQIGGIVQKYLGRPLVDGDIERLAAFIKGQEDRGQYFTRAMAAPELEHKETTTEEFDDDFLDVSLIQDENYE